MTAILELSRYRDPARGPFEPHTPTGERRDMGFRCNLTGRVLDLTNEDDYDVFLRDRAIRNGISTTSDHPRQAALDARCDEHRRAFAKDPLHAYGTDHTSHREPGSLNRKRTPVSHDAEHRRLTPRERSRKAVGS